MNVIKQGLDVSARLSGSGLNSAGYRKKGGSTPTRSYFIIGRSLIGGPDVIAQKVG